MGFLSLSNSKDQWNREIPLTAPGGPLDRGSTLREVAALFSDGRLLVSKSYVNSPQILSLINEAKLEGYDDPEIIPVDMSDVTEAYEEASESQGMSRRDDARMRREVLELVDKMGRRDASDIHVIVGDTSCIVRARIDGSMEQVAEWPPEYGHSFCAAAFAMADASDVNYQPYEYQAARISNRKDLKLPGNIIALRLQFNPIVYGGRAMIVRLLKADDNDGKQMEVEDLGFSPEQVEDFDLLRAKPFGINVVAGPTGHGKSTTLTVNIASIISEYKKNIAFYTVEDPPEYPIDGAVQMPVTNASTQEERSEAFTKAIAACMRSNPDRLMIGEVRDAASASLAFEAAMTGHQVWTTLHSNDAVTIPFRLRDLGVDDFKLTDHTLLTGLISQRLVRVLCPDCKRPVVDQSEIPFMMAARLDEAGVPLEVIRLRNPDGCSTCGEGNGYKSRTVVAEIIIPDEKFMRYVRDNDKSSAERYWLSHLGGRSMMEHAIDRIKNGTLDPFDAEKTMGPIVKPQRDQ